MPIAEQDVMWVEAPKLGVFDHLYFPAIATGLATTVKHMFGPPVTEQYPEQQPDLPTNYRGVHRLNRDEQGRVKCVACYMCATACPAHCIDIVAAHRPGRTGKSIPRRSSSTSCAASTAACASRPARWTPSS